MAHEMDPLLLEADDPRERGRVHGETWRAQIHELAEIRTELAVLRGPCSTAEQVLGLAALHLPVLERCTPALHAELLGIAEGADCSPEKTVVLNHYTDLKDIEPKWLGRSGSSPQEHGDPGGCTAIYFNGPQGPILGQTWDMHASAEPFVRMLRIRPRGGDREALVFTLTGCLGRAGMGSRGVGVTINNLRSTDAQIGLVWPALVRAMIDSGDANEAYQFLQGTPLSSGHHYMIADGRDFHGVECSGELKVRTQVGPKAAHLHTNHCFDPILRQREDVSRHSTTFHRLNMASTLYVQQRPTSASELWDLLGSHDGYPRSLCSHADELGDARHGSHTCGRIVMELRTGQVMASRGCSKVGTPLSLALDRFEPRPV